MRYLALAISLALVGTGCVTNRVSYRQMNPPPRKLAARPPETVEVISIAPQRPYHEVALIEALPTNFRVEDSFGALRKVAGESGCDAVVLRAGSDQWDTWRGTCIVWSEEAPETAEPSAPSAQASQTVLSATVSEAIHASAALGPSDEGPRTSEASAQGR